MANSYTDANGVYRNKLGITDAAKLKRTEYAMTASQADEILSKRVDLGVQGFGLARQQAIHGHLFQDVYDWAGKTRTVPSSKRMENGMLSVFANPDTFEKKWQDLEQKTHAFVQAKGLSFAQKHEALADIFVDANHIHPFPEGNGRSLQVFMKQLAAEQGINLDYSKLDKSEWNRASALSGTHGRLFEHQYLIPEPSNKEPIKKLFAEMASPLREKAEVQQQKDKTEAGVQRATPTQQDVMAYAEILKEKIDCPEKRQAVIRAIYEKLPNLEKTNLAVPAKKQEGAKAVENKQQQAKPSPSMER